MLISTIESLLFNLSSLKCPQSYHGRINDTNAYTGGIQMSLPVNNYFLSSAESYRIPMPVTAVRFFFLGSSPSTYPICPRCSLTMDREYQSYCDRCGQTLDWRRFSKAMIIGLSYTDKYCLNVKIIDSFY